ncbi:transporter substrate-binding domain-containing protein [Parahaliea mediterranea]|uniref:transporter substrate-binding domain-containing protein n=1 Tax=Parahaliea mediterranea TaxID=651086 RepID=UPI000E2EBE83|nr:transporter substrate-binding domain-containing protein [Parahaliea mediterranea]
MSGLFRRLILTSLTLACLSVTGLAQAGETLQRVIDFKTLKVGMTADQPPLNMLSRDKNLMGFDVDLAKALANAMRVKLEIKVMPFGDLMSSLDNGTIDMVISGMAITPERSEEAAFVGPYMMSGKSLLTKDSVLAKVSGSDEFNRGDLTLTALKNSTSASFVREGAPEATLIEVEHYDEAVKMILEGDADGMVADMPVCRLTVLRFPDLGLVTLDKPLTVEPIGIALDKDDREFFNLVDNYLEAYTRIGVVAQLRKQWLEDKEWLAALP